MPREIPWIYLINGSLDLGNNFYTKYKVGIPKFILQSSNQLVIQTDAKIE